MVTITRSAQGTSSETARALEGVVQEVLAGAPETLAVQFGTWLADDGRTQFVCRVETPPADPFGPTLQWRWWSPLVDGPEDLREALTAALQARRRHTGEPVVVAASAPAPALALSVAAPALGRPVA
jgi:hypothetical protein